MKLSNTFPNRKSIESLNFEILRNELELECSVITLERRLKQRKYFRYVACQKSYLTAA